MNIKKPHNHLNLLRDVLSTNKEMIARPAVALVPSFFSLLSLPLFIASSSLDCGNLENSPKRYVLISFYLISFIPQMITFFIHVHPSSFYSNEWRLTRVGKWLTEWKQRRLFTTTINSSILKEKN
jgi:hypothetical protein